MTTYGLGDLLVCRHCVALTIVFGPVVIIR